MNVTTATGRTLALPMTDPVVAQHFSNPNTLTDRLLDQINREKIYDFAFKVAHDWVMLDIGANVGLVSVYASDVCKRIVALEPTPTQFNVLTRMCWSLKQVEPLELALAGHNGMTEFFLNDVNTTASSASNKYGKSMMVKCTTLASLLTAKKLDYVDFAKVDIEGSETECLTPEQVKECRGRIRSYFVEVHNCPNSTWEWKLGQLVQVFSQTGYTWMRIRGDSIYAAIPK